MCLGVSRLPRGAINPDYDWNPRFDGFQGIPSRPNHLLGKAIQELLSAGTDLCVFSWATSADGHLHPYFAPQASDSNPESGTEFRFLDGSASGKTSLLSNNFLIHCCNFWGLWSCHVSLRGGIPLPLEPILVWRIQVLWIRSITWNMHTSDEKELLRFSRNCLHLHPMQNPVVVQRKYL